MGFGTLFLGYLFCTIAFSFPGYIKIFSYLILLLALLKLRRYNRHFSSAWFAALPLCLSGLLYLAVEVCSSLHLLDAGQIELFVQIASVLCNALELACFFPLLSGLQSLAKETDVYVLEVRSFRNRIFTTLYYLLFIAGQFNYPPEYRVFLIRYNIVILVFGLAVAFLNLKLFYNFYMWICLPEDAEMERKESRFTWVNTLRRKIDEWQEGSLKRRAERDAAYREEKAKKKKRKKK